MAGHVLEPIDQFSDMNAWIFQYEDTAHVESGNGETFNQVSLPKIGNKGVNNDISSGSVCFDFCSTNIVQCMTIEDSLSLNLNRCHYPIITYLSHC